MNAEPVSVHLVDGTFELFRCFHGAPRAQNAIGREVGAAGGLLATLTALLAEPPVTHVAVAFDSVVPPAGRTGAGASADELIAPQVDLAAAAARSLGLAVWPSGRYRADELIASAAAHLADDPAVARVVICSTDHDFHQCVSDGRVVLLDRIRNVLTDEAAVRARYGVGPELLPDLFALVGDRSDGLPGVPGWGVRSAATLLSRYGSVDAIPLDPDEWDVAVHRARSLAAALAERRDEALLCRDLARLRTDLPLRPPVERLEWRGADRRAIDVLCAELADESVVERIRCWVE